jgi:hypothetical protein
MLDSIDSVLALFGNRDIAGLGVARHQLAKRVLTIPQGTQEIASAVKSSAPECELIPHPNPRLTAASTRHYGL